MTEQEKKLIAMLQGVDPGDVEGVLRRLGDAWAQRREGILAKGQTFGYIHFDAATRVIGWSQGMEELLGFPADKILNKRFSELPHFVNLEDPDLISTLFPKVARGEPVVGLRVVRKDSKGQLMDCRIDCIPITGSDGTVQGAVSIFQASPRG